MNFLRAGRAYFCVQLLEPLRTPAFIIPTMAFPTLFFSLFDLQYARAYPQAAGNLMLAYVAFAIIGVALFQFGVGVAADRALPWERYLRTLPTPVSVRFASRIAVAALLALCAAFCVVLVASTVTHVHFSVAQWLTIALCAAIGAVPFVLFGLAIGYWTTPKSAVPIANLFYLLLAFAGGLWMPPQMLPAFARAISPFTPTRQFANLLWNAPAGISVQALSALGVFTLLFALIAAAGYRRDEQQRYG